MIVAVAGAKNYNRPKRLAWSLDYWHARLTITRLVIDGQFTIHPDDRRLPTAEQRRWGVSCLAQRWAMDRCVPWAEESLSDDELKKFGFSAPAMRSTRMLMKHKPERLIAFPGDQETADLVDQARRAGVKCIEVS